MSLASEICGDEAAMKNQDRVPVSFVFSFSVSDERPKGKPQILGFRFGDKPTSPASSHANREQKELNPLVQVITFDVGAT